MKSTRTKALEIPKSVKEAVYKRDKEHCVNCGRWCDISNSCCHFIARSQGGLGIEENILTLCQYCHSIYDNSEHRQRLKEKFRKYLKKNYKEWDERKLYYNKWNN